MSSSIIGMEAKNTRSRPKAASMVAAACLAALPALAWSAPDAGSVLQQLEARPGGALMAPKLKTPQTPTPPAADLSGLVLRVNEFRLEGHTLLAADTLLAALAGFKGRDLSLTQLQEAAWVLVQTYRSAGWLVHAVVPPQEIEGGIVTLRVVEARLGRVRIGFPEGDLPRERIQAMTVAHLEPGKPLSLRQLDRLLMLLDDMPGVVAAANFAPGEQDGSTDVLLNLGRDKPYEANLTVDNFGAISTGRVRTSASLSLNNGAGKGDHLQLQAVASEGSRYARVAYGLPVGVQGWRAGMYASQMNYHLVGSFAALQASGSSQSWGATLSVPLIRQPTYNLSGQLSADEKRFNNRALANTAASEASNVSNYQLQAARTSLSGNWLEPWSLAAQGSAGVQVSWGEVDLSQSPNAAADASGARTGGAFRKVTANYSREQSLGGQTSWYLLGSAQWANRNLDSSEKLYLGGASGVRAYPSNEAGGSSGSTFTTGLRHRLDAAFMLSAFIDWGRIQVYRNNASASGSELSPLNTQSLRGKGLSLSWRGAQGREVSATWSRRSGLNPAANPITGADSDGTRTLNRLWLSASLNY